MAEPAVPPAIQVCPTAVWPTGRFSVYELHAWSILANGADGVRSAAAGSARDAEEEEHHEPGWATKVKGEVGEVDLGVSGICTCSSLISCHSWFHRVSLFVQVRIFWNKEVFGMYLEGMMVHLN
jgi:hypothetical protein